jgi:hypothetical protein
MSREEAELFLEYDYEVDEDVVPIFIKEAERQRAMIERDVLPRLTTYVGSKYRSMADVRVTFVKDLSDDATILGRYISGSRSPMFIVLDADVIDESSYQYDVDHGTTIGTTLLHEVGHAVQDALGLRPSEKQAEKFAYLFWTEGKILPKFAS